MPCSHHTEGPSTNSEARRASSTGVVLDDEMQLVDLVLPGPRHRVAERSSRVVVDETHAVDPATRAAPPGKLAGRAVLDAEVTGDERAERTSKSAPRRSVGSRLERYDDFLRRP